MDFHEHVESLLDRCDVLLAVIGKSWTTITGPSGTRRLDDPEDLVRREIARALQRPDVEVIPVLVDGARILRRSIELPPDLAPLARRQACELSDLRWDFDVDNLARRLRVLLDEKPPRRLPGARLIGALVAVAVVAAAFLVLWPASRPQDAPATKAARLSNLTLDRDVTFGQYLDRKEYSRQPRAGAARPARGIRRVQLPDPGLPRQAPAAALAAVDARTGDQLDQSRDVAITPAANTDQGSWDVWVPLPRGHKRFYVQVQLYNNAGLVPIGRLRTERFPAPGGRRDEPARPRRRHPSGAPAPQGAVPAAGEMTPGCHGRLHARRLRAVWHRCRRRVAGPGPRPPRGAEGPLRRGCMLRSPTRTKTRCSGTATAPPDDICIYFIRSTVDDSAAGCASLAPVGGFPDGRPAAVVTYDATAWTLGHECGHLLGLSHVIPVEQVMVSGTWRITVDPPMLEPGEVDTIKDSPFAQPSARRRTRRPCARTGAPDTGGRRERRRQQPAPRQPGRRSAGGHHPPRPRPGRRPRLRRARARFGPWAVEALATVVCGDRPRIAAGAVSSPPGSRAAPASPSWPRARRARAPSSGSRPPPRPAGCRRRRPPRSSPGSSRTVTSGCAGTPSPFRGADRRARAPRAGQGDGRGRRVDRPAGTRRTAARPAGRFGELSPLTAAATPGG